MKRLFEAIPTAKNGVTEFLAGLRYNVCGTFLCFSIAFGFVIDLSFKTVGFANSLNVDKFQCQEKGDSHMQGLSEAFCQDRYAPIQHSWIIDCSVILYTMAIIPQLLFLSWWPTNGWCKTSILHEHRSAKKERMKKRSESEESERLSEGSDEKNGRHLDWVTYLVRILMVITNLTIRIVALMMISELTRHQSTYNEDNAENQLTFGSARVFSERWSCAMYGTTKWFGNEQSSEVYEIDDQNHETYKRLFSQAAEDALHRNPSLLDSSKRDSTTPWFFSSIYSRFYLRYVEIDDSRENQFTKKIPLGFYELEIDHEVSKVKKNDLKNVPKYYDPYHYIGFYKTNFSDLPSNAALIPMQIPFLTENQKSHCYTTKVYSRTATLWFYYAYTTLAILMSFASLIFEICLFFKRLYDKCSLNRRRKQAKEEKGGLPQFKYQSTNSTRKSTTMSSPMYQGSPIIPMTNKQDHEIRIHPQTSDIVSNFNPMEIDQVTNGMVARPARSNRQSAASSEGSNGRMMAYPRRVPTPRPLGM